MPPVPRPSDVAEPLDRGARARERLLRVAAQIFAEKGFDKASTREICQAAELNIAAIHYHFGGKEGLYREVLLVPVREISAQFAGLKAPDLPLEDALRLLLAAFVQLVGHPEGVQTMKLHLREMADPSPGYLEAMIGQIRPQYEAICAAVARHIGLPEPDDAVHQLVNGLIAMAQDFCISRDFYLALRPSLIDGHEALQRALDRMVEWGCAIVAHERHKRRAHGA
ncbi:MAG: CerR family C-terminal domain-containing protein [Pseudomonadota bacterium]